MKQFKYCLDETSQKFTCPKCEKKRFVKYINAETLEYLWGDYGRCDREENCGYHKKPSSESKLSNFVADYPSKNHIISYHTIDEVERTGCNFKNNYFVQFLKTLISHSEIEAAIKKYLIGTTDFWHGGTVYWQFDDKQNIRAGKAMLYDPITGKRKKNSDGSALINWMHKILQKGDFHLQQCLFGLHLLNEHMTTENQIGLVESEKTAVIMSIMDPQRIWMATGSLIGFKEDMILPLKPYEILAFPDKSSFKKWHNKANELNKKGFNIIVSEYIEKTNYPDGSDLADIVIDQLRNRDLFLHEGIEELLAFEKRQGILIAQKDKILKLKNAFDCTIESIHLIN